MSDKNKQPDRPPPNYIVHSSDGNFLYIADEYEVRQRQREEDSMAREKRVAYRERMKKGPAITY